MNVMIRDADGLPRLDRSAIEKLGDRFLNARLPSSRRLSVPVPVEALLTALMEDGYMGVDLVDDEKKEDMGEGVTGIYRPDVGRALLRPELDDVSRRETLGAIAGHFYLHSKVRIDLHVLDPRVEYAAPTLGLAYVGAARPAQARWQARTFSDCLLLPADPLVAFVEDTQRAMGITRRLGSIHVNEHPSSLVDGSMALSAAAKRFRVHRRTVVRRLFRLGRLDWDAACSLTHGPSEMSRMAIGQTIWRVMEGIESGNAKAA
jgi:hypothetical protein